MANFRRQSAQLVVQPVRYEVRRWPAQGFGLRVEPPRLLPEDCAPAPDPEGGADRTAGGGDDWRGGAVRAGAVLFGDCCVPREVPVALPFRPLLTAGDFCEPSPLFEPELPETAPRSR